MNRVCQLKNNKLKSNRKNINNDQSIFVKQVIEFFESIISEKIT